jgi:hypothetical protein
METLPMTNLELIREVRKPGLVYMPVLAGNDVVPMETVKAALLFLLRDQPADEQAIWTVVSRQSNCIYLDVA